VATRDDDGAGVCDPRLSFVLLYWLFIPTETNRFNGDNQLQIFPEQAATSRTFEHTCDV
jgi:hypothetical protein